MFVRKDEKKQQITLIWWDDPMAMRRQYKIIGTARDEEITKRLYEEAAKVLDIDANGPFHDLGLIAQTRVFWLMMEDEGFVPRGTWDSMKERS